MKQTRTPSANTATLVQMPSFHRARRMRSSPGRVCCGAGPPDIIDESPWPVPAIATDRALPDVDTGVIPLIVAPSTCFPLPQAPKECQPPACLLFPSLELLQRRAKAA